MQIAKVKMKAGTEDIEHAIPDHVHAKGSYEAEMTQEALLKEITKIEA